MTLLLRAIVAPGDAAVVNDLGLTTVFGAVVAALASPWDKARVAGEPELLDHHRLVQSVFERVPCLPARFGGVFPDELALHSHLVEREVDFASQLARLGHRCQL